MGNTNSGLDQLLKNEWELYDAKKILKITIPIALLLMFIIWWVLFFMVDVILYMIFGSEPSFNIRIIVTTIITFLISIIALIKINQMHIVKKDSYFSAFIKEGVTREEVLALLRELLNSRHYYFREENTHRTMSLWSTIFELENVDFKIRFLYSLLPNAPMIEIGIGPESELNRIILKQLRTEISEIFNKKYGTTI